VMGQHDRRARQAWYGWAEIGLIRSCRAVFRHDQRSQLGDGCSFKKFPQRNLYREAVADSRCYLGSMKRMSTHGKKIIVDADLLDPQNLAPDLGEKLLHWVTRRHKALAP